MGLLSAFSIALASFATEKIITAEDGFLCDLWEAGRDHVLAGAALAVLAACFFYLQRSHLAWHYGQIALAQSLGIKSRYALKELLADADGCDSWTRYPAEFIVLTLSFASYAYAVVETLDNCMRSFSRWHTLWLPLIATVVVTVVRWCILVKYAQEDEPFKAWCKYCRKLFFLLRGPSKVSTKSSDQ